MKNLHDHSGIADELTNEALSEAALDAEIAAVVERSRPRVVVPKALTLIALVSLVLHASATFALMMHRPIVVEAPRSFQQERVFYLDLDLLHGEGGEGSAAPLEEEVVEVAEAAELPPPEQPRLRRRIEEPVAPEPVEQTAPVVAMASVPNATTTVQLPTSAGEPTGAKTETPTLVASAGPVALTGGPRVENATGVGDGADVDGLRRGHVSRLNRAIRSQNPCSPALRRSGARGDVIVALQQNEDGSVASVRVARSSGDDAIDATALDFVRSQRRLPRPESVLVGDTWTLPMRFECGR